MGQPNFYGRYLVYCILALASLSPVREANALTFRCTAECIGRLWNYTETGECTVFGDIDGNCCKNVCQQLCAGGGYHVVQSCRSVYVKRPIRYPGLMDSGSGDVHDNLGAGDPAVGDADSQQEDPTLTSEEIYQVLLEAAGE